MFANTFNGGCRRIVPILVRKRVWPRQEYRNDSSIVSRLKIDPSRLILGLSKQAIEADPEIADFIEANYPEAFIDHENTQTETESENIVVDDIDIDNVDAVKENKIAIIKTFKRNIRPLRALLRDEQNEIGSADCRVLRKYYRMIPGLLYGSDPTLGIYSMQPESKTSIKVPLSELQREIDKYHRSFESRVYDLTVYENEEDTVGTVHRVTPKHLQRHPVHPTVFYCANFCRYHPGRPLKLPIVYINEEESPTLKRDGFIVPLNKFVECFVEDGADIPERIELECTGLGYRDVIRTDRLILPDGVRLSDRVRKKGKEFLVGVVFGKNRGALREEEEEAAEAAQKKKK